MPSKLRYLKGRVIAPIAIRKDAGIVELEDPSFQAFNAGRLQEAASFLPKNTSNPMSPWP
jgi:hypothetical protein